jgi:glycosyltransferase involved in cell wall biosynthesis
VKILLLARYGARGASSRVRFYQYLPALRAAGHVVDVAPFFDDGYLDRLYAGRPRAWPNIAKSYWRRLGATTRAARADLIWLEGEILPWAPAWLEGALALAKVPCVVDYDDAAFHRYDRHPRAAVRALLGRKIDAVMRRATLVVAGNAYIADRARRAGARRVERLPSVVDTDRFVPGAADGARPFTLGWIGTPSTQGYLAPLEDALSAFCAETGARVVLVGPRAGAVTRPGWETRPWTEDNEVAEIQKFDVGLMPLPDDPWTRGKCGYKLIQYGACGVPVVASPVGANIEIVAPGETGFLAADPAAWTDALRRLGRDPALRERLGRAGRDRVVERYSLRAATPVLLRLLSEASRGGR